MSKYAGWILFGWLCVSVAAADPQAETKPAESPLRSAADEILRRPALPVAERDRLLDKLLTEAEAKANPDFETRFRIAAYIGDRDRLNRQLDAWLKQFPNDPKAHTLLLERLHEKAEILKAMPAALVSYKNQSDRGPYLDLMKKLINFQDFENARIVAQSAFENSKLDQRDEWLVAFPYFRFVHSARHEFDAERSAQLATSLLSDCESHLQRYMREGMELRYDYLSMVLDPYISPDYDAYSPRRIEFLQALRKIAAESKRPEDDRRWCEKIFVREQVTLLHRAGRHAEAMAVFNPAFEQVQKQIGARMIKSGDLSEYSDWLQLQFRIAPLKDLAMLSEKAEPGGLKFSFWICLTHTTTLSLFEPRAGEDTFPASRRIAANVDASAAVCRALCERWIAARELSEAKKAHIQFAKMASVIRFQLESRRLRDADLSQVLNAIDSDVVFFDVVINELARRDKRSVLERLELPRENWYPKPMTDEELRNRAVLLCYGRTAGQSHYQFGRGQVQNEGLPISTDPDLDLAVVRHAGAKFTLIGLVDDEEEDRGVFSADDRWRPTTPAGLLTFLERRPPVHPVVYACRSKLTDTLFRGGQSRALLFDKTGSLRRVYSRYPNECQFHPIAGELKALLEAKTK